MPSDRTPAAAAYVVCRLIDVPGHASAGRFATRTGFHKVEAVLGGAAEPQP